MFNLVAEDEMKLTNNERLTAISNMIATTQGRTVLANSMAAPLRKYRDYTGIGRKAFQVDELGQGEQAYYDKDINTPSYIVAEEGTDVRVVVRGERVYVPMFEIATNIMIPITKIRERRYDLQARVKEKTRAEMIRREDKIIFETLDKIGNNPKAVNTKITVAKADLSIDTFSEAKAQIERHGDVYARTMFINPVQEVVLRRMNKDRFIDFQTTRELLYQGYIGNLFNMNILKSPEVPENKIYITAEPEFFGKLVIGQDITVLNADEPKDRQLGFSVFEQLGILVHNDQGLSVIEVTA